MVEGCYQRRGQVNCNHSQEGIYIACVHCDIEHAILAERERIIKLLEDKIKACNPHYPNDDYCDGCDENRAVIGLIKDGK